MRLTRLATWIGLLTVPALLAAPAAGALVHRYTFEGGAADDTVGGLNPSATAAVIDTAAAAEGTYSAFFDGVDDYIGFDTTAFNDTGFSVAMWVQPASFFSNYGQGGDQALLSNKGAGAADGFSLYFDPVYSGAPWMAALRNHTANGSGDEATAVGNAALLAGPWQHVACTVDRAAGTCRLYIDGTDQTVASAIRTDFAWDGSWRLGLFTDGGYDLYGRLDDVQIYDEVLPGGAVRYLADNPGSVIPEPVTTIGLLLGGAALTAYSRRRQRRK